MRAGKSVMAAERGLAARAISRGTVPNAELSAGVVAGLGRRELHSGLPGGSGGKVCGELAGGNGGVARDDIRKRVEKLVAELAAQQNH